MSYVLNLVIGCWLTNNNNSTKPYDFAHIYSNNDIQNQIKHWTYLIEDDRNSFHLILHDNPRVEHFEVYQDLPKDWKKKCHTF